MFAVRGDHASIGKHQAIRSLFDAAVFVDDGDGAGAHGLGRFLGVVVHREQVKAKVTRVRDASFGVCDHVVGPELGDTAQIGKIFVERAIGLDGHHLEALHVDHEHGAVGEPTETRGDLALFGRELEDDINRAGRGIVALDGVLVKVDKEELAVAPARVLGKREALNKVGRLERRHRHGCGGIVARSDGWGARRHGGGNET